MAQLLSFRSVGDSAPITAGVPAFLGCTDRFRVQLWDYPHSTSLEARIIPKLLQLVCSDQGRRVGFGNWTDHQLVVLEGVLLSEDSAENIRNVRLDFSCLLTDRNDANWAAWREAFLTPALFSVFSTPVLRDFDFEFGCIRY